MMDNDIKEVLFSEQEINEGIAKLGQKLTEDYKDKNPLFVGLLKGVIPFIGDLTKNISCFCEIDYLRINSYEGKTPSGHINLSGYVPDVKGKDVIIVDDILDTGNTTNKIKKLFTNAGARSVKICVLLNKPEGRLIEIEPDYYCFTVPNKFVVGYGLDFNQKYRNLPYIGVLKEEVYER